jgi:hypothetical protein
MGPSSKLSPSALQVVGIGQIRAIGKQYELASLVKLNVKKNMKMKI